MNKSRWIVLAALSGLIVGGSQVFLVVPPPGLSENRQLAEPPTFPHSVGSVRETTKELELFAQDHFPPRAHLIAWLNWARYRLGYSTVSRVVVGEDGWLFYNYESFKHFLGLARVDIDEQRRWVKEYQRRQEYIAGRGGLFVTLIAPQKYTIYPEKLPGWLVNEGGTETDDLVNAARSAGITSLVDPRQALKGARAKPLYGPFDTHWTGDGAYVAYSMLMDRISTQYPDLKALPQSDFTTTTPPTWAVPRDLALMMGIAEWVDTSRVSYSSVPLHEEERTLFLSPRRDSAAPQVFSTDAEGDRTLLLIRDSFAMELLPLLKKHFKTIVFVHSQDGFFRKDLVERYNPDVVVLEMIETGLKFVMPPL
ncbi:hypothetical protein HGP14_33485 [Rhizobium sp. P32RR-XVIII]|uniref:alginate O-acetyltransferase AlgX-related protein n=1 Tax=Rhizobium sp. P32RR-XVIII TaxID=2726738 RepID=UPI001456963F|nr:hypothetical protein [Rhizobium sp. P32RR-XVIII]NLS08110.1 hypothetical protein [Rhizobium sp. P32RR-XVIII]